MTKRSVRVKKELARRGRKRGHGWAARQAARRQGRGSSQRKKRTTV